MSQIYDVGTLELMPEEVLCDILGRITNPDDLANIFRVKSPKLTRLTRTCVTTLTPAASGYIPVEIIIQLPRVVEIRGPVLVNTEKELIQLAAHDLPKELIITIMSWTEDIDEAAKYIGQFIIDYCTGDRPRTILDVKFSFIIHHRPLLYGLQLWKLLLTDGAFILYDMDLTMRNYIKYLVLPLIEVKSLKGIHIVGDVPWGMVPGGSDILKHKEMLDTIYIDGDSDIEREQAPSLLSMLAANAPIKTIKLVWKSERTKIAELARRYLNRAENNYLTLRFDQIITTEVPLRLAVVEINIQTHTNLENIAIWIRKVPSQDDLDVIRRLKWNPKIKTILAYVDTEDVGRITSDNPKIRVVYY